MIITTYEQARTVRDNAEQTLKRAGAIMDRFPKGPMGLTPDSVKAIPEWKAAKMEADQAFATLRAINAFIVKYFKKESRAERDAIRQAKLDALALSSN